ncbi:MAG: DNA polymerase IV [Ruminococcaceae bacterium]|nr:DNA polymerase IV [Oscillospiraceae bacterium]
MEKIILHSDLNNFFASVEAITDPRLAGEEKFIAVCGLEEDRHGIVLAKNENAKRMGVKTGDTIWQAKQKCPDIIIAPPHFDKYNYYSKIVREIYSEYTDEVEPFGLDECWLDVTRSTSLFGSGATIANTIRKKVKSETGLTVSVGVSFNKIFAKLCSDIKKPDAVTIASKEDFREKLWSLSASNLLGVGRASIKVLENHGIFTIGDIARTPCAYLEKWLGKNGATLYSYANGLDDSPVTPCNYSPAPKSISHGITCRADLENSDEVARVILYLCRDISAKLRKQHLTGTNIAVFVKNNKLQSHEYSVNLPFPTRSWNTIYIKAFELFSRSYCFTQPVRALSIHVSRLSEDNKPAAFDIFTDVIREEKREKKETAIDKINAHFGKNTILPASLLCDIKLPCIINESILPPAIRSQ